MIRCKHGSKCNYMKKNNCNFYHPQEDYIEHEEDNYEHQPKKLKLNMNKYSSIFLDISPHNMIPALKDLKEKYDENFDILYENISNIYDTIDSIKTTKPTISRKKNNEQIFKKTDEIKNLIMNIVISNKNKIKSEKTYNITIELMNKYKGNIKNLFRFIYGGPRFKNTINEYDTSFWILENMDLPIDSLNNLLKSYGFIAENKLEKNYENKINLYISCI